MSIKIKNVKVLESMLIHPYHPTLIKLLQWFCVRYSESVFTGGYDDRDYPSVHSTIPVRGEDMRSWIYLTPKDSSGPENVQDDVNGHWVYDPDRPQKQCAVYHAVCKHCNHNNMPPHHAKCEACGRELLGWHLHLQVHDKTEYKPFISR